MNNDYISISEFAKRAGVSRQTVYSRLDGDLSNFCKVVKGKKAINIKALSLFGVKESVKDFTDTETLKSMVEVLQSQAEMLRQQLEVKDQQIAELNERLKENSQSLRAITHKELADRMIEEKSTAAPETEVKRKWSFFRKKDRGS